MRDCSYLNMRGCEEEGLYRVPGAAHQIRYYEQKFDRGMDPMLWSLVTKAKDSQTVISILLPMTTSTTPMSLAPCSRTGYGSFQMRYSRKLFNLEFSKNARAPSRPPKC
jgi:hypothetical protein